MRRPRRKNIHKSTILCQPVRGRIGELQSALPNHAFLQSSLRFLHIVWYRLSDFICIYIWRNIQCQPCYTCALPTCRYGRVANTRNPLFDDTLRRHCRRRGHGAGPAIRLSRSRRSAPRTVNTAKPQNEACSKASELTPLRWLCRRFRLGKRFRALISDASQRRSTAKVTYNFQLSKLGDQSELWNDNYVATLEHDVLRQVSPFQDIIVLKGKSDLLAVLFFAESLRHLRTQMQSAHRPYSMPA